MKEKYLFSVLLFGYASSCFSMEVLRPVEEVYNDNKKREIVSPKKMKDLTEFEVQAVQKAVSHGVSQKDLEKGLLAYKKKITNHPELAGVPFDIFVGGMISFDNYL